MLPLEDERAVDLVRDEPEIVAPAKLGERLHLGAPDHGAGGIVGAVDQHRAGPGADGGGDVGGLQAEAAGGIKPDAAHGGAGRADHGFVGHVHGLRHDDLVARVQQAQHRREQGALGAGHDHDVLRPHRLAGQPAMAPGDGGAQGRVADDVGVMGAAVVEGGFGRGDDGRRRVEVGLADREHDDVLAAAPALHRLEMHGPGARTLARDPLGQMGEFHGAPV